MSRADIYYAYQRLYAEAPFISQAEYRRRDARLFARLLAFQC
jgi:hypothetical protein